MKFALMEAVQISVGLVSFFPNAIRISIVRLTFFDNNRLWVFLKTNWYSIAFRSICFILSKIVLVSIQLRMKLAQILS